MVAFIASRFSFLNAIWIFVPSILSIICEIGQYLSAYWVASPLLRKMERENLTEVQYPARSLLYKARKALFWCKLGLAIIAAAALLFTLFRKFA